MSVVLDEACPSAVGNWCLGKHGLFSPEFLLVGMKSLPDPGAHCKGGGVRQDNFWSLLSMVRSASKERVAKPEIAVTHGGEKPHERRSRWEPGSPGLSQAVAAGGSLFPGKTRCNLERSEFTASWAAAQCCARESDGNGVNPASLRSAIASSRPGEPRGGGSGGGSALQRPALAAGTQPRRRAVPNPPCRAAEPLSPTRLGDPVPSAAVGLMQLHAGGLEMG